MSTGCGPGGRGFESLHSSQFSNRSPCSCGSEPARHLQEATLSCPELGSPRTDPQGPSARRPAGSAHGSGLAFPLGLVAGRLLAFLEIEPDGGWLEPVDSTERPVDQQRGAQEPGQAIENHRGPINV